MWSSVVKQCAAQAVHLEVRAGLRPHANTIPCSVCGHVWREGERRHEWDHHRGYDRASWFDVVVLCTLCHHAKSPKAQQTHCIHGHEFNEENTVRNKNGTRRCRACQKQRARDRAKNQKVARHALGLQKPGRKKGDPWRKRPQLAGAT